MDGAIQEEADHATQGGVDYYLGIEIGRRAGRARGGRGGGGRGGWGQGGGVGDRVELGGGWGGRERGGLCRGWRWWGGSGVGRVWLESGGR